MQKSSKKMEGITTAKLTRQISESATDGPEGRTKKCIQATQGMAKETSTQQAQPRPKITCNAQLKSVLSVVVDAWWDKIGSTLSPDSVMLKDAKLPSALAGLANNNKIPIKLDPVTKKPSLLLSNLPKTELTEWQNEVYKDTETKCMALFGVPGIGKTRQLFEILSIEFGHYFSVDLSQSQDATNITSRDFNQMILAMAQSIPNVEELGDRRHNFFFGHVGSIMHARTFFLEFLQMKWRGSLTPFQWLLIQLFPNHFLGGTDVFYEMYASIARFEIQVMLPPDINDSNLFLALDEAQILQGHLDDMFPLRTRDPYECAHCDTLSTVAKMFQTFASLDVYRGGIVAGTGFRMTNAIQPITLGVAQTSFAKLETKPLHPLDEDGVKAYIGKFLALEHIDNQVLDFIAKWLVGRPRWTASFIERWIKLRGGDATLEDKIIDLGNNYFRRFYDQNKWNHLVSKDLESAWLFVSMCDFLRIHLHPQLPGQKSGCVQTASSMVCNFVHQHTDENGKNLRTYVFEEFRKAVFKYACDGRDIHITDEQKQYHRIDPSVYKLIENGLCLFLESERTSEGVRTVRLCEPIIAEAALRYVLANVSPVWLVSLNAS